MHIAVVAPLPPLRSGVASYAAEQIYWLAKEHKVTAYVPDLEASEQLRGCELADLSKLPGTSADVVLYHVGNSLQNLPQVRAALTGPPGIIELHDGSLHHLLVAVTIGLDDETAYKDALTEAHGSAGAALAETRSHGSTGTSELALFDVLAPVLERHHRVIVHSQWAKTQVARRIPQIPTTVVAHHAPKAHPRLDREMLGLDEHDLLIGHAGFVTTAKRPERMVATLALLRKELPNAKLVLLGTDQSNGELSAAINRHGQQDSVICTGYLSDRELLGFLASTDVALALRSPHVGESSGPIAAAFSAGVPVVTQAIGAWAELPKEAVLFAPIGEDETTELAKALASVLSNPATRSRMGAAALRVALTDWHPQHCAQLVTDALALPAPPDIQSPEWVPAEVTGHSAVAVGAIQAASDLRISGWQVATRSPEQLCDLPVGQADLLVWGDAEPNLQSLGDANRCLAASGKFMWLNPPNRANDALHRAGFTDGTGAKPLQQASTLIGLKTRLPGGS